MLHEELKKQLDQQGLSESTPPSSITEWGLLLEKVSKHYEEGQNDQLLAKKSFQIASEELQAFNAKMFDSARLASLGEVAGGVAHEINNPLAILLFANESIEMELAEENPDIKQVNKFCQDISREIFRIKSIINALTDSARDGSLDAPSLYHLGEVMEECLKLYQTKTRTNDVALDIQNNIPEMAGNTTLIVSPEHGRNLESNNIVDANAFTGFDHSDANSRRIFNMVIGPGVDSNLTIGNENNQIGDIVNITPTIAEILGFKNEMMGAGLTASNNSLFDLI